MRGLLVLSICASLCCGHPRVGIVGGMTFVGAIGVGLPLSQDCAEHAPGDCGLRHDATYLAVGAAVGAALGLLAQYEYARQTKEPASSIRTVPSEAVEPRPLPVPELGPIATCVRDQRDRVDQLERRCRYELTAPLEDLCDPSIALSCEEIAATIRVLGFAIGEQSIATAEATAQAERKCWEAGGVVGTADVRCECGNTCGCVADVECL